MGVYIPNMEMPTNCRDCPLCTYYMNCGETRCRCDNATLAENFGVIPYDGKPEWCRLIEVATPHGNLIDEDEIYDEDYYQITMKGLDRKIVIEAEK